MGLKSDLQAIASKLEDVNHDVAKEALNELNSIIEDLEDEDEKESV